MREYEQLVLVCGVSMGHLVSFMVWLCQACDHVTRAADVSKHTPMSVPL
jgi:hypothetical protein